MIIIRPQTVFQLADISLRAPDVRSLVLIGKREGEQVYVLEVGNTEQASVYKRQFPDLEEVSKVSFAWDSEEMDGLHCVCVFGKNESHDEFTLRFRCDGADVDY